MELVELAGLTAQDWEQLVAGEQQPWGPDGEGLQWREKERNLGLRADDGTLLAAAGAAIVDVEVEDHASFQVVGLGGLFVTRAERGAGFVRRLAQPLLDMAREMGPERAMIFCRPELIAPYERLGFAEIPAPVWVDQPGRRLQMPMRSMWTALREGAVWPPGRVDVRGLPF